MKIDAENYQEWALDYLEGGLDAEARAAFESLLAHHPDIASEIHALESGMPVMPYETVCCPFQNTLLRGSRLRTLHKTLSYVGGAAAASVLVGGFLWFDQFHNHVQQREQELVAQTQSVYQSTHEEQPAESLQHAEATQPHSKMGTMKAQKEDKALQQNLAKPIRQTASSSTATADASQTEPTVHAVQTLFVEPISPNMTTRTSAQRSAQLMQTRILQTAPTPEALQTQPSLPHPDAKINQQFASLIAPFDNLLPIRRYRTENERGIEIISLIRIGNRN